MRSRGRALAVLETKRTSRDLRLEAARRRAGAMHPIDQSLDIIIPERLRARHWEGFSATMQTGRSRYGEGRMLSVPAIRKDDAPISVEFTIVPFANDSGR